MRRVHSTITPTVVHSVAQDALARALPWHPYGQKVSVASLLRLLLLVAVLRSSVSAVLRRFRFGFSHETGRKAVYDNLPDTKALTAGLVDALFSFRPRSWWQKRRWTVAIDLHTEPFYGDPKARGVVGGQKKQGTHYGYCYATAKLIHRRCRYTVGLLPVDGSLKPHEIVAALLAQIAQHGLELRGVVLDSGFDSGEVILLLQERKLGYTIPLRRKGNADNRRNACFKLPAGTLTEVEWVTEKTRRAVKTQAVVVYRKKEDKVYVYAYGNWGQGQAVAAAERAQEMYKRRFGIETGYRQKNECKGKTTAKNPEYRLLLVGVALLVRQVWVWLTAQIARSRRASLREWIGELPLQRLRSWLEQALRQFHPEVQEIELNAPLWTLAGIGMPA
jgi:hypothetical protein